VALSPSYAPLEESMHRELGSEPTKVEIYGGPLDGMKARIIASRVEGNQIIDTLRLENGQVVETARMAVVNGEGLRRELGT
jgi:hypothetical protein